MWGDGFMRDLILEAIKEDADDENEWRKLLYLEMKDANLCLDQGLSAVFSACGGKLPNNQTLMQFVKKGGSSNIGTFDQAAIDLIMA